MNLKKSLFIIFTLCVVFGALFSFSALAQDGYNIEVGIPGGPVAGAEVTLADYLRYLYLFALSLVGLAAFGALVYGGILYMVSDSVGSKADALKWIWGALLGLLLGFAAWMILNTINPDLVMGIPPSLDPIINRGATIIQKEGEPCFKVDDPKESPYLRCEAGLICDKAASPDDRTKFYICRKPDKASKEIVPDTEDGGCSKLGEHCQPDKCCTGFKCNWSWWTAFKPGTCVDPGAGREF